jgi:hypothetical protein
LDWVVELVLLLLLEGAELVTGLLDIFNYLVSLLVH